MPATVTLVLGRSSHAELYVFDISGRAIRRLIPMTAEGSASLKSTWDLRDETGRRVSPGMYWVRARTESEELRRAVHVLQ